MSKQRRLLTPVFLKMDKYCPCTEDAFERLCEACNSLHFSETGWHLHPPTLTASHLLCPFLYPSHPMSLRPSPSLVSRLMSPLISNHNTELQLLLIRKCHTSELLQKYTFVSDYASVVLGKGRGSALISCMKLPAVLTLPEPNTKHCKETQAGETSTVFLALRSEKVS